MESKGEVCLEEEVDKRRRSGMSTDDIAQDMGVDRAWVLSIVSMVAGEDPPKASSEPERG